MTIIKLSLGGDCYFGESSLTAVLIALGFSLCAFPVPIQFFPDWRSHSCDHLFK